MLDLPRIRPRTLPFFSLEEEEVSTPSVVLLAKVLVRTNTWRVRRGRRWGLICLEEKEVINPPVKGASGDFGNDGGAQ